MKRKIKAKIKGNFTGTAIVILDNSGNIEEVQDIDDIDEVEDCEIIYEIYQIGG